MPQKLLVSHRCGPQLRRECHRRLRQTWPVLIVASGALSILAAFRAAASARLRMGGNTTAQTHASGAENFEADVQNDPAGHVKVAITSAVSGSDLKKRLTWGDALRGLSAESPSLRDRFSNIMKQLPFEAYFWECSPVSAATMETRLFEFVALEAPRLAGIEPDEEPFSEHLSPYRGQPISRVFPNLGGDSLLVAPAPAAEDLRIYAHAASFFRRASPEQLHAQWRALGDAIEMRLRQAAPEANMWVSTEGSGVSWLHMRVDPLPKYYHHDPYRSARYGIE